MSLEEYEIKIADRIEGLKQPFEHGLLQGQSDAQEHFIRAANSGRIHHAWLLSGPRGCGKATFAFRMARYFVEEGANPETLNQSALDTVSAVEHTTFRKVASGAHPNILHLKIPFDDKLKKFKTQLSVEEMRRCVSFFGSTASNKGWRVAIVDTVNDMNANAANALLKVLEEPPEKTLFFLIADKPNRLLPTIRSRCQPLSFKPLESNDLSAALKNAADEVTFDLEDLMEHQSYINGSVRRAFHFATQDAGSLLNSFNNLIQQQSYEMPMLHAFADQVSARGAEDKFLFFIEFVENYITEKMKQDEGATPLVSWAEVWDKVHARLRDEESLNLDRKQTVLALFHDLRL